MSYSSTVTVAILVFYVVIGLVPKVPLWAKILLQLVVGLVIYKAFGTAMFALPNGDNLPMSDLFGGSEDGATFNKYALGVLGTVVGILFSLIGAAVGKLMSRRKDSE